MSHCTLSATRPATRAARARRHAVARACSALAAPLVLGLAAAGPAWALDPATLPSQGQVVGGIATLAAQAGQLTVTQHTGRAVIDWGRFDVGSAARVDFVQPGRDAVAINRVTGGEASLIHGRLQGNGHVFIVNPAGVVFGAGAEVQVGGLLATTLPQAQGGSARNRVAFDGRGAPAQPAAPATVRNEGRITVAEGGSLVLLGAQVVNTGTLVAPGGEVTLAAGEAASVVIGAEGRTTFTLETGALAAGTVRQAGVVQAQSVSTRGGVVRLLAPGGDAELSGAVDVGAAHGQAPGALQMHGARVLVTADAAVTLQGGGRWSAEAAQLAVGTDIAAPVLGASLQHGDVTLTATQGALSIDAPVAWHSGRLALNAAQGLWLNANLDATLDAAAVGGGRLALAYGLAAPEAGNAADYRLAEGVKVALPAGETFSTRLGSDGVARDYTVITQLGSEGVLDGRTLQGMAGRLDGWFALGADIDAAPTAGWTGGEGFVSVGDASNPFTGRLAGLGHAISGLAMVRSPNGTLPNGFVGLFAAIERAGLRDLSLVGGEVRASSVMGALVGRDRGGSRIEGIRVLDTRVTGTAMGGIIGSQGGDGGMSVYRRLYSRAELRGAGSNNQASSTGGVIQFAALVDMEDVRSDAVMPPSSNTGGIAADLTGRLVNVHSSAHVFPGGTGVGGGLVGRATLSEFRDSSATGNVSALNRAVNAVGGLVGVLGGTAVGERLSASGHVTITGGYALDVGGLVGRSSIALRDATASGNVSVDVTNPLSARDTTGIGGLVGQMTGPGTSSGLRATGNVTVDTAFRMEGIGGLMGSSTATLVDVRAEGAVSARSTVTDLGNLSRGVGGLVGVQTGGAISDAVALGSVASHNARHTGGLVGSTDAGLVRVSAAGNVTHTGVGLQTGGLVGRLDIGAVDQARATGAVSSSGNEVGGLVGTAAGAGAAITGSYATGAVSGLNVVGGLVGNSAVPLRRVFASGDVTGSATSQLVGGLVGQQLGVGSADAIADAYASGRVNGSSRVGGLVGQLAGRVARSHSTGAVLGTTQAGGLVGAVLGGSATASYWNTQTSGRTTSAAGTGLTSAQMASPASFAGWDIGTDPAGSSVWLLAPGQAAPTLRGLTP
jgi:filamentous hemagglutinin family protein